LSQELWLAKNSGYTVEGKTNEWRVIPERSVIRLLALVALALARFAVVRTGGSFAPTRH
jgi:hypothetical protein